MSFAFYSPAPRRADEAHRQSIVDASRVFEHADDPELQRLVDEAATACNAPVAAVSIVDNDRQWFIVRHGVDARETPRAVSFCAHTQLGDHVFTVPNATADARFSGNPLVTGPLSIRFYAGAPLIARDGTGIGALCVIDSQPRLSLTTDQERKLTELADAVMSRITEFSHASGSSRA